MPGHSTSNCAAPAPPVLTPEPLAEHRALQAWQRLGGDVADFTAIETIQKARKSSVYRLLGRQGANVIAKRCRVEKVSLEEIVHTQLLPRLGLPRLRYCGNCDDPDLGFRWLFVEDAGDVLCEPHTAHLAARWLGQLHTRSGGLSDLPLPHRGDGYYLGLLHNALELIGEGQANTDLTDANRRTLDDLCAMCGCIERQWSQVAGRCAEMPTTVLHGDFVPKNIRVQTGAEGDHIVVLDWETAGWGVPGVDILSGVIAPYRGFGDIPAYLRTVQVAWPWVDLATLQRWGAVGMLFRVLSAIYWRSQDLNLRSLSKVMANFELYLDRLTKTVNALQLAVATPHWHGTSQSEPSSSPSATPNGRRATRRTAATAKNRKTSVTLP